MVYQRIAAKASAGPGENRGHGYSEDQSGIFGSVL